MDCQQFPLSSRSLYLDLAKEPEVKQANIISGPRWSKTSS